MDIGYIDFEPIMKNGGFNGFGDDTIVIEPEECDGKSVNEVALEVIQGLWGNGDERKNRLIAAGCDYDAIQNEVNRILGY